MVLALHEHDRKHGGSDADFEGRWLPDDIRLLADGSKGARQRRSRPSRARVGTGLKRKGSGDGLSLHLSQLSDAALALQGCGAAAC